MSQAFITHIGGFLPNDAVGNEQMESILGMVGGRPSRARRLTLRNNGIQTRHYAIDPNTLRFTHTTAQLAAEAVRAVLRRAQLSLGELECLACGTSSADQIQPSHAHMVHGELASPACEVMSAGGVCTSGMHAMKYAYLNVASGLVNRAVASGAEMASSYMIANNFAAEVEAKVVGLETRPELAFEKDFLRWMLSDGAGAALIQSQPNANAPSLRIDWIESISYAGEMPACMYSGAVKRDDGRLQTWREVDSGEVWRDSYFALKQDARLLNEHIVELTVARAISAVMKKRDLHADRVTWFLPHYSSEYFKPRVYKALTDVGFHLPYERWFSNLTRKGNVGSAAIYLIMEELLYSGRLKRGDTLLCYVPESARFSVCYMHLTVV